MSPIDGESLFVVTGGGSGMGRDVALSLSRDGRRVVVVGRRQEPLRAVADVAGDGAVETVQCDLATVNGFDTLRVAIGDQCVWHRDGGGWSRRLSRRRGR